MTPVTNEATATAPAELRTFGSIPVVLTATTGSSSHRSHVVGDVD